ncbi:LysR family transcriptional regulator [Chromobacterium sp. ATCC 53434]|uniref:LysR family transcriptional regulator n=1 Tax=Chromobacterium sp. (strain ATCC 53434 / SC 14030) TaxID=2059672 RepID=UPI000C790A4B|nr:LysR family transcriptional regulator [Chromobacterium sp. ATCC 53434]AUH49528.1 LysR family transcriptional regulator [Chromobacterium sp. ATCC 53434]
MQWDDVRYFLALAREGSLSAGARTLGVEHSTMSRRVGQLEAALGLRLFDRLPRGWQLTQEGENLLPQALALETGMAGMLRAASAQHALSGQVRLTAPPQLLNHVLLPLLTTFRQRYPDIDLTLLGEQRRARLEQGEADLALRLDEANTPELIARPLAKVGYALYGTARWRETRPGERLFIGFDDSLAGMFLKRWLDQHAGERRVALRGNDLDTHFQAAKQGLAVALLPHFLARSAPELIQLDSPPTPDKTLYLLMHPDVRRAPRVRALADFIIDALPNALA